MATQRLESSVTPISWIPSEAITGPSATLWARTPSRVAAIPPDALDPAALSSLDASHRREV